MADNTIRPDEGQPIVYGVRVVDKAVNAESATLEGTATLTATAFWSLEGTASIQANLEPPYATLSNPVAIASGPKIIYQGRDHGPYQGTNYNLYLFAHDSVSDELRIYTSRDRTSWTHLSAVKLSTWGTSNRWTTYQGPKGTAYEDHIYLAKQNDDTNAEVRFWQFDMSTETWTTTNELIKNTYNSTWGAGATYPCVSIAHRYNVAGDYEIVVIYNGYPHNSGYQRVDAAFKEPTDTTWTTDISVDVWQDGGGFIQEFANDWAFNTACTDRNDEEHIHIWHQELGGSNSVYWKTLHPEQISGITGGYVEPYVPNHHYISNLHKTPLYTGEYEPMGFCIAIKTGGTSTYTVRALAHHDYTTTYSRGEVTHTETDVNNIVEFGDSGPGETPGGPFTKILNADTIDVEPDFHWNAFGGCIWDGDKAPGTDEEEHHVAWISTYNDTMYVTQDGTGDGYIVEVSLTNLTAADNYAISTNLLVLGSNKISVHGICYNDNGTLYYYEKRLSQLDTPGFPTGSLTVVGNGYADGIETACTIVGDINGTITGNGYVTTLAGTVVRDDPVSGTLTLSSNTTVNAASQVQYASSIADLSANTQVNARTSMPVTGSLTAAGRATTVLQGVVFPQPAKGTAPIEIIVVRGGGDKEGEDIVDRLLSTEAAAVSRGRMEMDRNALPIKNYELDVLYSANRRLGNLVEVHDLLFNEVWQGKVTGISHKVGSTSSLGVWSTLSVERPFEFATFERKHKIIAAVPAQLTLTSVNASIEKSSVIQTVPATISATGHTAQIRLGTPVNINTTPQTLSVTGNTAVIKTDLEITTTAAALSINGVDATIAAEIQTNIETTPRGIVITGVTATIAKSTAVATTPRSITVTTSDASISESTTVSTTPAAINIAGTDATIETGFNLNATPASIDAAGVTATVNAAINISTTPQSITVTGVTAYIIEGGATEIDATPATAHFVEVNPTVQVGGTLDNEINATPATLSVTTANAAISTGVKIDTTPATAHFVEVDPTIDLE